MIKQIEEINFPSYLTLHQATISLSDMGERTISAQVKIDGDIVPDFIGTDGEQLAVSFKGEKFVLPIREPQAAKDNTTRNSLVDMNFESWPIDQMKRFFFMEMASIDANTAVPDRYVASVSLSLQSFVTLLNQVLQYYFDGKIVASLNPSGEFPDTKTFIEIDHSYIWDVIQKIYEAYAVRWEIEYESANDRYVIKIGYPISKIQDHDFEYGFEGGLLKFERQVQDENVNNILLGRGGEKNLPYRYFKRTDPQNTAWAADPDAIPELQNIYFDRLRDANFRRYVQGWRTNPNRDTSWEAVQPYDSERGAEDFAYKKGHEDDHFNPIEYVKDDESIARFGERWGYIDNNDDIYPTIQGVIISDFGRIDEVVAVSPITTDDIDTAARAESTSNAIDGVTSITTHINASTTIAKVIRGAEFSVPTGATANLNAVPFALTQPRGRNALIVVESFELNVYDIDDGTEVPPEGIPAGDYRYEIEMSVRNRHTDTGDDVTFGAKDVILEMAWQEEAWKPTFEIWVKNLFNTEIADGETPEAYAHRVWDPVLGDRVGNQASIAFSDGFMSISEDYNFVIAKYPEYDQSKSLNGVTSEWKITLRKSDAEYETTGYFVPNSKTGGAPIAGDHFYLLGVDMPHILVTTAEEKLNADKTARLTDTASTNPTWVVSLDKVRITRNDSGYLQTLFDRINAGTEISVRDKRFTNNESLKLIVQSLTYTFNEPTDDNPAITPDIEVVLSAKTEAGQSTIEKLQGDIDIVRASSVQIADIDAIIKRVASQMFLKKSGENELSLSPTRFASRVSSEDFSQGGIGGTGWGTYRDDAGKTVIEADKVIVREELKVNSLVVNQIAYIGGRRISSAAAMECIQVIADDHDGEYLTYTCYFDQKQGTVQNLFVVGDIAMSQQFDPSGNELKYYKMDVVSVGENYIELSDEDAVGSGTPMAGDIIVQYGNTTNASRRYVIEEDVIGGGYIKMISGLNSTSANGTTYFFAGSEEVSGVNRSRLFIGGNDSHIQYSESDGLVRLKGNLVQSPSGSEFPVPCNRGDYSSSTRYYYGDMVVYEGQSWIRMSQTSAVGDTPATPNWMLYSAKGDDGAQGPSALYRGVWDASVSNYYGDQYRVDVVKFGNTYYRAKATAGTIPANTAPTNSQYWMSFGASFESIATGLLVAENATIENAIITKLKTSDGNERIEAFDNYMSMTDDGGNQRLIITGDNVDITGPSVIVHTNPIVHDTPSTRYQVDTPEEEFIDDFYDVIATFSAGANSTISIPAMSFTGGISNADVGESEEVRASISAYLEVQRLSGENWIHVSTLMNGYAEADDDSYKNYSFQNTAQSVSSYNMAQYRIVLFYHIEMQTSSEGTTAYINLGYNNSGKTIVVSDNEQKVSIGANGFSASLGNDFIMNCAKDTENNDARVIEMKGKDSGGNIIGVKISSAGLQFTFGNNTYTASRDTNGYLKLT